MAIFKSQLLTQASGSVGGITFSHNAGGNYIRARAIPTDPNSPQQQAVRAVFGNLAIAWETALIQSQREAWETYAANVPILNALGDQIFISGLNHYIRSNTPRVQAGVARIDVAPTVFNLGDFSNPSFAYDSAASEIDTTFTVADDWVNEDGAFAFIYGSRQKNETINFHKGPYRFAGTIIGSVGSPETSPSSIAAPFPCAVGNRCFNRFQVSRADGRLSLDFRGFGLGA